MNEGEKQIDSDDYCDNTVADTDLFQSIMHGTQRKKDIGRKYIDI